MPLQRLPLIRSPRDFFAHYCASKCFVLIPPGRFSSSGRFSYSNERWAVSLVLPHLRVDERAVLDAVREVVEALALAVDVSGGAVQAAAERIGVAQVDGDDVHAELVHLLLLVDLGGLDDDRGGIQDQAVHGQPHGAVAQRGRLVMGGLGGVDDLPIVGLEDVLLALGRMTMRVVDDQARTQRHEGGVDVNRVRVAREVHGMDAILG